MPNYPSDASKPFSRGVVVLSFDAEQIWGYLDHLDELQFRKRYPNAPGAYEQLLECLCSAGISATWLVVAGMTLGASEGAHDPRMIGLPNQWTVHVPAGSEATMPLWYRRSFVERLREARPRQEVGLHGGLTHLIWTHPHATLDVVKRELAVGIEAMEQALVRPRSFSFPRDQEAYHELLPAHGIRCYRGRTPVLAYRLGRTISGALLRGLDELRWATPPPVWPEESLPGLWKIPSSLFLYPIGPSRTRVVALRSRVERFRKGMEAAIRYRGIFHFCLHPDSLAESPDGFSMFGDTMDQLIRAREAGDVEILTMAEVADRMHGLREPGGFTNLHQRQCLSGRGAHSAG